MGWFGSSEENNEETLINTDGHVNNNIIIQEAKDTHLQAALSEKLVIGTYVLITLEIIKLIMYSYSMWKKHLKKKYNSNKNKTTTNNP